MNPLLLTLAVIGGLCVCVLLCRGQHRAKALGLGVLLIAIAFGLNQPWNPPPSLAEPVVQNTTFSQREVEPYRPVEVPSDQYVGSAACQECHLDNHATWEASYHRTMTQVATHEAILGDFDNVRLEHRGEEYILTKNAETCMVDMPDLGSTNNADRLSLPIVMTTGSHHMQVYWFATGAGRMTGMLPLIHLNETNEWIPRSSAFLTNQREPSFAFGRWNDTCSKCHTTHRKERSRSDGPWDTHVSEFGISCEACHGPGQDHILFRRDHSETVAQASADLIDPIVNPETLSKTLSAQTCGQCHSVNWIRDDAVTEQYSHHGSPYRPGKDLDASHLVYHRDTPEHATASAASGVDDLDAWLDQTYYRDGMLRVSGREYNGLTESACYQRGEMTCLSCHQMHKSASDPRTVQQWADDQLKPIALSDQACLQCHDADQYGSQHTHHQSGSSGASCYNCHMPHQTYGLLKAMRNHTISSPNIGNDTQAKRPNACNLCHLDKTLAWSARHLEDWYGIDTPELNQQQRAIAASLLWILKGDAGQRALAAWSMGWKVAQDASGNDWIAPFLAQLLNDPYDAVRLISRRSLQTLPKLSEFNVDVVMSTSETQRTDAIENVITTWKKWTSTKTVGKATVLIDPAKGLRLDRAHELIRQRDDTPMNLAE